MSFIVLVILVGGGAWIAHAKFHVSWGQVWGSIGAVAFLLVRWAFKQEHEEHQQVHERVRRLSTYNNEELKDHANNYSYSPQERSAARHELEERRKNGTGPF
ncbi:hypothetical protein [Levilactobacillus zymae]|uniref:hypothetical protein n=1 Tax=Levilactobacillus zymae TaxID=267363 RepID=UPI0028B3FE3D|nr:hypothetical protein [Levilactobacillus zymae]MDT6979527.1 hypothetical protein [Levilactobacillus zymae]